MRNVARGPIPKSLAANAGQWLQELLEELAKGDEKDKKLVASLQKRYNKRDVRKNLSRMYSNYCCYCEANVAVVGADQIEHLKPKDPFPNHTFDWENLHLVCAACNRNKSSKWDDQNPILDPVADAPISEHLEYMTYMLKPNSERGKTTIDHTGLNRDALVADRRAVFECVFRLIESIAKTPEWKSELAERELDDMVSGQYGSLVEHVRSTARRFGREGRA